MRIKTVAATLAAVLFAGSALAEVKAKAPDALIIQIKAEVALDRDEAWARLLDIGAWWSSAHTYSGDASSLRLDATAGGCWCEFWSGGEVEHGRVIQVAPKTLIRMETALGPLQAMGVSGAMTLTLGQGSSAAKSTITLEYQVAGSSLSDLDKIADGVDQVLTEQIARFASGA